MPAQRLLTAALRLAPDPGPADRDLLAAFAATRDEAAFAELVRRHGSMVLAACRRVTGHAQDAEDAFQAAFLVLARRAGQVKRPDQLANWLYGVAVRTALDARKTRRRIREHALVSAPEPAADPHPGPDPDLAGVVDEELARLPEKLRAAVVLCELEGVPRKDAASRLGIPEGTLSSRLAHARKVLADRLARRGVVAPAGLLAAVAPTAGGAVVPAALIDHTARVAARAAGGAVPPGLVSDRVSSLTDGVLKAMLVSKLRTAAGVVALAVAAAGATAVIAQQPFREGRIPTPPDVKAPPVARPVPGLAQPQAASEKVAPKGIEDDDVPYPTAPFQAVVRVEDGKMILRQRVRGGPVTAYGPAPVVRAGSQVVGQKLDASDVQVFDMKGNRLAAKVWREKLQQDQHVLVAWGGVLLNPRELVLYKDDTLIVVFPGPPVVAEVRGAGVRTEYRAIPQPDGTILYRPYTVYDPSPSLETIPGAQPVYTVPAGPDIVPVRPPPSIRGTPVPDDRIPPPGEQGKQ